MLVVSILIYSELQENKPPKSVLVQEGYIYPRFRLTEAILSSVGVDASAAELFQSTFSIWSRISNNHVVSVDESPAVFVRNAGVENCVSFDTIVQSVTRPSNIRTNLSNECHEAQRLIYNDAPAYVNKKRRAPDSDGEVGVVDVKDKGCAPVFESDAEDSPTSPPQPW